MTTIPIDIPLPDAITQRLTPPSCDDIRIKPPETLNLCLPFGGQIQGIVDVSRAIPDDCSLSISLLLQLQPMLASLGCFIKVLKLAQPLMDFVQAVPSLNAVKIGEAVGDLLTALTDIVKCFTTIQANAPKFVRDLMHMIAKLLKCLAQTIKSISTMMGGLEISIQIAQASGNQALMQQLQCAKDNASAQAQAAMGTVDVISLVVTLAEPLLGLAGMSLTLPSIGPAQSAEELADVANTMLSIGTSIDQIATTLDGLGC
jgi:hypothetical protein